MFVSAIEQASKYTRPVFTIARRFGDKKVLPGAATLFFVNEEGWAVTSKQVAKMIIDAGKIEKKYAEFKKKKSEIPLGPDYDRQLAALAALNQYKSESLCQLKVNFVDCVDRMDGVECKVHPQYDVALLHFHGYRKLGYTNYATFAAQPEAVKPGRFLCRLGYPFPEFKNFRYDEEEDDIVWTKDKARSPRFPADGMITRLIAAEEGEIVGIEMSTPGLKGLTGGPLFDPRGIVYGMQSRISPLHLGQCVHMDVIKAFLLREGVKYYEDELGAKLMAPEHSLLKKGIISGGGHGKMN